jgi:hypothetical protein
MSSADGAAAPCGDVASGRRAGCCIRGPSSIWALSMRPTNGRPGMVSLVAKLCPTGRHKDVRFYLFRSLCGRGVEDSVCLGEQCIQRDTLYFPCYDKGDTHGMSRTRCQGVDGDLGHGQDLGRLVLEKTSATSEPLDARTPLHCCDHDEEKHRWPGPDATGRLPTLRHISDVLSRSPSSATVRPAQPFATMRDRVVAASTLCTSCTEPWRGRGKVSLAPPAPSAVQPISQCRPSPASITVDDPISNGALLFFPTHGVDVGERASASVEIFMSEDEEREDNWGR